MINLKKAFLLIIISFSFSQYSSYAQEKPDTVKSFKNSIRINLSNPILFGEKNFILGYERVFKNNQSITANIGLISFPQIAFEEDPAISTLPSTKDIGYGFAIDYRFYLKKENKYNAPRGIYIGPY